MKSVRENVLDYVKEKYGTLPDYPWQDTPDNAVLRHSGNKKWYGLIMNLPVSKVGINEPRNADFMNIKCDPLMIGSMRLDEGIYPAYHMNKNSWVSIILDGTVDFEKLKFLIDISYSLTIQKTKKAVTNKKLKPDKKVI